MIVIGDGYAIGPNGVLRDGTAGRCDPGRVGAKARKARGKVHQTLGGAIKN